MLSQTDSSSFGAATGRGASRRTVSQAAAYRAGKSEYVVVAPKTANACPLSTGPAIEAMSQVLANHVDDLTIRLCGTTWASRAVIAGPEKARAIPTTKMTT